MKLINYLVQGLKKSNCGIFIFSLTTTYEDLLLSSEPFQQPIPLAVSFSWDFFLSAFRVMFILINFLGGLCRKWLIFWLTYGSKKACMTRWLWSWCTLKNLSQIFFCWLTKLENPNWLYKLLPMIYWSTWKYSWLLKSYSQTFFFFLVILIARLIAETIYSGGHVKNNWSWSCFLVTAEYLLYVTNQRYWYWFLGDSFSFCLGIWRKCGHIIPSIIFWCEFGLSINITYTKWKTIRPSE